MSNTATTGDLVQALRQQGLRLAAVALGTAMLLALAWHFTSKKIAFQRLESARQSLDQLLPASSHDNDLLAANFALDPHGKNYQQIDLLGLGATGTGHLATLHGKATGVILPLETAQGYGGAIMLVVGIFADGNIAGVRVLQHRETPGLGDKIDLRLSPWITGFNQQSLAANPEAHWHVKKDGGDFDQFVGATITPRAVVTAVHNALLFFEANRAQLLRETP